MGSLEAFNRAIALGAEVGNRNVESLAQRAVNHLQSAVVPRAELAGVLIRQLEQLQQSGDTTTNALLPVSEIIVLLNDAGRPRTAALLCGWLDGRSG